MIPHHKRYVVCAAIKRPDRPTIICGPRHGDCVNQANNLNLLQPNTWEMGFVDQDGVFMDRKEAWVVADAAGQIRNRTGYTHDRNDNPFPAGEATVDFYSRNKEDQDRYNGVPQLFSEHLY